MSISSLTINEDLYKSLMKHVSEYGTKEAIATLAHILCCMVGEQGHTRSDFIAWINRCWHGCVS
jgi:hypothetical protein